MLYRLLSLTFNSTPLPDRRERSSLICWWEAKWGRHMLGQIPQCQQPFNIHVQSHMLRFTLEPYSFAYQVNHQYVFGGKVEDDAITTVPLVPHFWTIYDNMIQDLRHILLRRPFSLSNMVKAKNLNRAASKTCRPTDFTRSSGAGHWDQILHLIHKCLHHGLSVFHYGHIIDEKKVIHHFPCSPQ